MLCEKRKIIHNHVRPKRKNKRDIIGKVGTSGAADENGNIDGKYDAHLHLTFFQINVSSDIPNFIKKEKDGILKSGVKYDNNKRRNPFDHLSKKKSNI